MLLLNILLAVAWVALTGELSLTNAVIGFLLALALLWTMQSMLGGHGYFKKYADVIRFCGFFAWELVKANFEVALDIITPRHRMRPTVVAVPLDVETDAEIALLANLITLTPGTLSLDVSPDRKVLYVHSMYGGDPDTVRRTLKEGMERRVQEVLG